MNKNAIRHLFVFIIDAYYILSIFYCVYEDDTILVYFYLYCSIKVLYIRI